MTDDKLRAALDAAWRELEMDALASDGPIRDSDVKDAIKRNRVRIEAAALAASATDEGPLTAAVRLVKQHGWLEHANGCSWEYRKEDGSKECNCGLINALASATDEGPDHFNVVAASEGRNPWSRPAVPALDPAVSHEAPVSEAQANSGGGASATDEGPTISDHDRSWFLAQAEQAQSDDEKLWLRPSEVLALARPAVPALDVERLYRIIADKAWDEATSWVGDPADGIEQHDLRTLAEAIAREYAALQEPTDAS